MRRSRTSSVSGTSPRSGSSPCARSPRTSRARGARACSTRPGNRPLAERILALVTPQPRSQRLLRRAWRSAQRLDAELDVLWIRRPARSSPSTSWRRSAALRRLGVVLGAHFLEEESDDFVATVREVVLTAEPRTSSSALPTPVESRRCCTARSSCGSSARFPASTSASSPIRRGVREAQGSSPGNSREPFGVLGLPGDDEDVALVNDRVGRCIRERAVRRLDADDGDPVAATHLRARKRLADDLLRRSRLDKGKAGVELE